MRVSIGLGLIALASLVACASDVTDTPAASYEPKPTAGGSPTTSTDPTEPGAPPAAPEPPKDPADPEAPPAPIVSGLAITDIAMFQAVKVPVMATGTLVQTGARKAPVVAKRPGMMRVYVKPAAGWKDREVTAELRLVAGDKKFSIIRDTKRIGAASTEEDPSSTFNLEVPGESLPDGVTFQVALTAPDGEKAESVATSEGRYPRDGRLESLGTEVAGKLRVVVVPVKYDADGSGRVPPVGQAQLDLYKKTMMRLYPAAEIEMTAHEPYSWTTQISTSGSGFPQVLKAMADLRQKDGAAKDVYYYGLLAPKASFAAYCGGGCVTGLSAVVDNAEDAAMRASVGIGFGDQVSANTMAHEIGHAHGRLHAPCGGPAGPDPKFPYQGGGIGAWGYDIFDKTFIPPTKGKDIMGYCRNEWVSDYTYNALFERISAISTEKNVSFPVMSAPKSSAPKKAAVRVAIVGENDDLTWDGDLDLDEEPVGGEIRKATFFAESGAQLETRTAKFFRFDHLPGGFLFVPKDASLDATRWKAMSVEGFANQLAR